MKTLVAKFPGRCFACDARFEAGTKVAFAGTGRVWHLECWEKDLAEEKEQDRVQAERCAKDLAEFRAGLRVRTTLDGLRPLTTGQPGCAAELFVTGAVDYKMARDEAQAFVASVRAAGGRAKLLGHTVTQNGVSKHYVGKAVVSYYGMSTLGHHEGWKFPVCTW